MFIFKLPSWDGCPSAQHKTYNYFKITSWLLYCWLMIVASDSFSSNLNPVFFFLALLYGFFFTFIYRGGLTIRVLATSLYTVLYSVQFCMQVIKCIGTSSTRASYITANCNGDNYVPLIMVACFRQVDISSEIFDLLLNHSYLFNPLEQDLAPMCSLMTSMSWI